MFNWTINSLLLCLGVLGALIFIAEWYLKHPDALRAHWQKLGDLGRASPLLLLFAITFLVVCHLNPAKAGLALWGVSKIAMGGYLGYWADRLCFRPEDRPHRLQGIAQGTAWKRRAVIVAAAILAGALIP